MSFSLTTGGEGTVATAQVVWSVNGQTYKFRSDNNFLSWITTIFTIGDTVSQYFINPQGQTQVYVSSTSDLDLLGATGTKVDLYTVPSGYRFFSDQFALTFTNVAQTGAMSGVTQPSVRIVKNNSNATANQISNEIQLSDAGQTVQLVNKYWRTGGAVGGTTSTTGKATATSGDVLSAYITSGIVSGVNTYTTLTAKCFLAGWLIPL